MVAYNGVVCTPLLTPLVHYVSDLVCGTFFKNNSLRYTCPSFQEELDFSPSVWVQQMGKDLQPCLSFFSAAANNQTLYC